MLKIRLMRIGAKKRPFYRIVAVDERNKRNGTYLDLIGTYNPLSEPKEIKIDKQKLEDWLKKGAQKSDGLLRILKEAPQRHRKPKKEQPAESAPAPKAEEAVVEAPSETPVEEPTQETAPELHAEEPRPEADQSLTEKTEEQIATGRSVDPRNDGTGEETKEEATA